MFMKKLLKDFSEDGAFKIVINIHNRDEYEIGKIKVDLKNNYFWFFYGKNQNIDAIIPYSSIFAIYLEREIVKIKLKHF